MSLESRTASPPSICRRRWHGRDVELLRAALLDWWSEPQTPCHTTVAQLLHMPMSCRMPRPQCHVQLPPIHHANQDRPDLHPPWAAGPLAPGWCCCVLPTTTDTAVLAPNNVQRLTPGSPCAAGPPGSGCCCGSRAWQWSAQQDSGRTGGMNGMRHVERYMALASKACVNGGRRAGRLWCSIQLKRRHQLQQPAQQCSSALPQNKPPHLQRSVLENELVAGLSIDRGPEGGAHNQRGPGGISQDLRGRGGACLGRQGGGRSSGAFSQDGCTASWITAVCKVPQQRPPLTTGCSCLGHARAQR